MSAIAPTLPLTIRVRPGDRPARQGEPCFGIFVVETGVLLASCVTDDGRRLGELLGPGDAVGGPDGMTSQVTVRALRACRLRPAFPHERPSLLDSRTARAIALAHDLAWLGVADRVERRLRETAKRFGYPAPEGGRRLGVRLTQEDLAELVGCTRESANRAIRTMVADGRLRVTGRGRYVLPTPSAVPQLRR
jgi:CRP-like cAMP-binding protein